MHAGMLIRVCFGAAWGAMAACGEVSVKEQAQAPGARQIVMENASLKLAITPALGGRVTSFVWKTSGKDWVLPGNSGFLMDHVWQQSWPGELLDRSYDATIVKSGPDIGQVQVGTTIKGGGDRTIAGLKLIRTMTLKGDRPRLDVTIRLENPTPDSRSPGLWVQNVINVGGVREGTRTWRPTCHGVIGAYFDPKAGCGMELDAWGTGAAPAKNEMAFDPSAGWSAEVCPEQQVGVVFLMDYNWLRCLYACGGSTTLEWWYDQVRLAPGKSFETHVTIWPFRGLKEVTHADSALVAGLRMEDAGSELALVHSLVAGPDGTDGPGRVLLEFLDYDSGQVLHSEHFEKVAIGSSAAVQKTRMPRPDSKKNLLARATVTPADGKARVYEIYRPGAAVIGTERNYQTKRPLRTRPIERPAIIAKTPHEGTRILHLRGLFQEAYRLRETTKLLAAELKAGSYTKFVYGPGLSYFPGDYAELMGYDVIVLNNVPAAAIDETSMQYLKDYVEHGGVLLVIGGHWAFGGGGYKDSCLEELLPVKSKGPFDLLKIPDGRLAPAPDARRTVGALWVQNVIPRPEASVPVKAGDRPFWIQWRRGQGVVAVLAGLAYGESSGGTTLFGEWDGWPKWLAGQLGKAIQETRK